MQPVRLTFYGAAGTVTGSKYLVESDSARVLVDCGIFQGKKELRLRNWDAPQFDPRSLSAIVLTHAHIDHSGYLPVLVKRGYRGPIYCTPGTDELVELLLLDSGRLQEEEAAYALREGTSKHQPPKPLYTELDAREVLPLLRVIPRGRASDILPGVRVFPACAGHILGSACLNLESGGKRITFSGDIGRYDTPILPDPAGIELGDMLLCESTYGDREHGKDDSKKALERVVKESFARGGPLIIPAFALGRTQTILYLLAELEREGRIPALPVFVDSPMATDVSRLYRQYDYDYDQETEALVAAKKAPLSTQRTIYCRTSRESKALNDMKGARIVISASGMVTGGRILHHMLHWLPDDRATVLFVGYQAEDTRGQIIQSGAPDVKIFGRYVPIRAQIRTITGLSAHADRTELIRWLKSCTGKPARVKVVHGEPYAASSFAAYIKSNLGWDAEPARHLECVEI